jgi:2-dehydro-3-deoxyphosphogluconate aldolase/(4S)-4-hydroxy-2-oxoglutarate aldolase
MPEPAKHSAALRALLAGIRVIPVVTLARAGQAVPLARALAAGGLPVVEVTLRSPVALDGIAEIARELPEAVVGAGSLRRPAQIVEAQAAGARFGVSPGHTAALLDAAETAGLPYLPGAASASEAMALFERGYDLVKLFPAAPLGGPAALRALAAPLPEIEFCPTGGIGPDNLADYLACPNVPCVGGSWIAPPELLAAGDWTEIEARARAAATIDPPRALPPGAGLL